MVITFYNTLSRRKEKFIPIKDGEVSLYTCGPTVYGRAHIGNFRTFLFEDVLKRFLQLKGYNVTHVMNITDVDDKTIKKCNDDELKLSIITKKYTKEFMDDIHTLKILPADTYPAATQHIPEMITMIEKLVEKKHGYITEDGSVFFNIHSYKNYGKLSNLNLEKQQQSARVAFDEYSKENPQDFALWKTWKQEDGDVGWDSPWGKGRPGWHLECSVMSTKYLGDHFDIHCGGVDNIFPHHENEIAQTCAALDTPFVTVWMHSEHLNFDDSKMSKSLGNIITIPSLTENGFSPECLRFALLSSHYRSKLSFSEQKLQEAKKAVQRINDFYNRLNSPIEKEIELPDEYTLFMNAMSDDLNTPKAFGVLFNYIKKMNRLLDAHEISDNEIAQSALFIEKADKLFAILQHKERIPHEISSLIEQRENARKNKDWNLADLIRNKIKSKGWIIEDTPDGFKCYLE